MSFSLNLVETLTINKNIIQFFLFIILNNPPDKNLVENVTRLVENYIKEKLTKCETVPPLSEILIELYDPMMD